MYLLIYTLALIFLFFTFTLDFAIVTTQNILILIGINIVVIAIRIFIKMYRHGKLSYETSKLRAEWDDNNTQYEVLYSEYLSKYGTKESIKNHATRYASSTGSMMSQVSSAVIRSGPNALNSFNNAGPILGGLFFLGEGISWLSGKISNFFKSEEQKSLEARILYYENKLRYIYPRYNRKFKQLNNQNMYLTVFIILALLFSTTLAVMSHMNLILSIKTGYH